MRALFVTIPGHGHFAPLAPLAQAALARGHDVRVASSASFAPVVEAAGLKPVSAGLDWLQSSVEAQFPEFADLPTMVKGLAFARLFEYAIPRSMVADLEPEIRETRPDVIVTEPEAVAGDVLAEMHRIPHAVLGVAVPRPVFLPASLPEDPATRSLVKGVFEGDESLVGLRAELGLAPITRDERMARPALVLDTTPPSLHLVLPQSMYYRSRPLRPVQLESFHDAPELPADARDANRPRIHVSLGTVFERSEVLATVVQGLVALDANIVVATGLLQPDALGALPSNVLAVTRVAHQHLLPTCALFVTHGGWGSMINGLAAGVPLLVLPQAGDQFTHAARVRSVGAGDFLMPHEVSVEEVRRSALAILSNELVAENARRMAGEIAAMPDLDEGVDLLEALANTGPIDPVARFVPPDLASVPSFRGYLRPRA